MKKLKWEAKAQIHHPQSTDLTYEHIDHAKWTARELMERLIFPHSFDYKSDKMKGELDQQEYYAESLAFWHTHLLLTDLKNDFS